MGSTHLAVDLGAESGRAFIGKVGDGITIEEVGRFRNRAVQLPDRLAWDLTGIHGFIVDSVAAAGEVSSLAIDCWAVDFALLRADGSLTAPPRCYRDPLTAGILEDLHSVIPASDLYRRTGIQMMEINTICQLFALARSSAPELAEARRLLLIPDLLRHWLGADPAAERTNASTTQLLSPDGTWDTELAAAVGLEPGILPPIVDSYETIGGHPGPAGMIPIIAGAAHDTAAAVAGTPLGEGAAFISSGTWSLVGVELPGPIISDRALALNMSNEHGVGGTTRFLRNVMGLWLLQQCRQGWARADGHVTEYAELVQLAATATPGRFLVDPDHASFLRPDDMPAAIAAFCAGTGGSAPASRAEIVRCVIDSLALRYRWVLEALESCTGNAVRRVNIVGGGSQNALLCQATADATGLPVEAGPVEATVLGNLIVQAVATGSLASLAAGSRVDPYCVSATTLRATRDGPFSGRIRSILRVVRYPTANNEGPNCHTQSSAARREYK